MFRLNDFIQFLKNKNLPGASQAGIGELIGKPQAYVSQICKGERPFLEEYMQILAAKYGDDIVYRFNTPDTNQAHATNGSTAVAGNGNSVNRDFGQLIEIIDRQSTQLSKSQEQIDRLLTLLEKK